MPCWPSTEICAPCSAPAGMQQRGYSHQCWYHMTWLLFGGHTTDADSSVEKLVPVLQYLECELHMDAGKTWGSRSFSQLRGRFRSRTLARPMKEEWKMRPYLGVLPLVLRARNSAFSAPRICTVEDCSGRGQSVWFERWLVPRQSRASS